MAFHVEKRRKAELIGVDQIIEPKVFIILGMNDFLAALFPTFVLLLISTLKLFTASALALTSLPRSALPLR